MPHDSIGRVGRRLALVHAVRSIATAVVTAAITATALFLGGVTAAGALGAAFVLGGVAAMFVWQSSGGRRGSRAAATAIERAYPASNVVITAEELHRHPDRVSPWVHQLVEARATQHLASFDASAVVSLRPAVVAMIVATGALLVAFIVITRPDTVRETIQRIQQATAGVLSGHPAFTLRVTIEPPAYTGRAVVTLDDPERLDVLEGSVVRLAGIEKLRVRFGEEPLTGPLVARVGGYLAIERPGLPGGRLLPLVVTPDTAPTVRVEDPGKDLLLAAGGKSIPVKFSALDDLALGAMELLYTKVSGTGEQFEFQEGKLPITLEQQNPREWRGRGQLSLGDLRLEPGDSLVYRVVARDRRPGDVGLGSSDTYFIEIAGPGQVALEGVEMPPDMERYALSQQMIVLKLERLRARETSIPREALVEETATIAAEQRAVRANFIFLMGGHVEDEEVEAEQSHEIQEGRLENTARRDINTAIGHMTRVEQGLAAVSTATALPPARLAVEALQRAFGRSRYLLRSLAVRSRLDMSRRLAGDASRAGGWHRESLRSSDDRYTARSMFDRLVLTGQRLGRANEVTAEEWQDLAESALRIDPASGFWQGVSRSLSDLRTREPAARADGLEQVIRDVAPHAERESLAALGSLRLTPVSRAWRTEHRR